MKKLFLYKLYLFDKRLFFSILAFSAITILCNIKGAEITPFFIWAMYSENEPAHKNYPVASITVNDSVYINPDYGFTDNNRFFLNAPLSYFARLKQQHFNDPTVGFLQAKLGENYQHISSIAGRVHQVNADSARFVAWYVRYLQQSTGILVKSLKVDLHYVRFDMHRQLRSDSILPIIQWQK